MSLVATALAPVGAVVLYPRDGDDAARAAMHAAAILTAAKVRIAVPRELVMAPRFDLRIAHDVIAADELGPAIGLVVAVGGDGTLLRAARWVGSAAIPVMGVNLGNLGFLAAFGASELDAALAAAIGGELVWQPRLRMQVEIWRGGELRATQSGCNDIYVKHGELPRMLRLRTTVDGSFMADVRADGLIVSTPMGSTAYNLAAGGPIVDAGTNTWTITPICPHTLTHRPVVTSADQVISITHAGPDDGAAAMLSVDGQWSFPLDHGDEVRVRRADVDLRLVPPRATVFDVLQHKLGWS